MDGAFIPPWIKPANETENFMSGYQIGQRDAAMAIQVNERAAEQALQAQRIEQEAELNRQRLAANAKAQQLKQQEFEIKAMEASRRNMAAMKVRQLISAGVPEDEAVARHAVDLFGNNAASYYAARARMSRETDKTPKLVDINGKKFLQSFTGKLDPFFEGQPGLRTVAAPEGAGQPVQVYTDATGKEHIITPKEKPLTPAQKFEQTASTSELNALVAEKKLVERKMEDDARLQQDVDAINKLDKKANATVGGLKGKLRLERDRINDDIEAIKRRFVVPPTTQSVTNYVFDQTTGTLKRK